MFYPLVLPYSHRFPSFQGDRCTLINDFATTTCSACGGPRGYDGGTAVPAVPVSDSFAAECQEVMEHPGGFWWATSGSGDIFELCFVFFCYIIIYNIPLFPLLGGISHVIIYIYIPFFELCFVLLFLWCQKKATLGFVPQSQEYICNYIIL